MRSNRMLSHKLLLHGLFCWLPCPFPTDCLMRKCWIQGSKSICNHDLCFQGSMSHKSVNVIQVTLGVFQTNPWGPHWPHSSSESWSMGMLQAMLIFVICVDGDCGVCVHGDHGVCVHGVHGVCVVFIECVVPVMCGACGMCGVVACRPMATPWHAYGPSVCGWRAHVSLNGMSNPR